MLRIRSGEETSVQCKLVCIESRNDRDKFSLAQMRTHYDDEVNLHCVVFWITVKNVVPM